MIRWIDRLFGGRPLHFVVVAALFLTALVADLDYATGYELSFSVFYLAPIALVTWYGGQGVGAVFCLLGTVTWFAVDRATGHVYSYSAIPVWNALVRGGFFAITTTLLVALRDHLELERGLARRDGLTGLLNARAFREACEASFDLARRQRRAIALAYFDLDDFKTVNDTLGHAGGDRVLTEVARVLSERLRETDRLGRLGGDEFALVLPDTDRAGAEQLLSELRRRVEALAAERGWPIGLSVGGGIFVDSVPAVDSALRAVDTLMYEAKRAGKNTVVCREIVAVDKVA